LRELCEMLCQFQRETARQMLDKPFECIDGVAHNVSLAYRLRAPANAP